MPHSVPSKKLEEDILKATRDRMDEIARCWPLNLVCVEAIAGDTPLQVQYPRAPLPDRPRGTQSAYMISLDKWEDGHIIMVAPLDEYPPGAKRVIQEAVNSWTTDCNICIEILPYGDKRSETADVRITFHPGESYSVVGRPIKPAKKGQPTMNLAFTPGLTEEEMQRKARHEFGHVLGLRHEHSSPAFGLSLKEGALIDNMVANLGVDREQAQQMFAQDYAQDKRTTYTKATKWDPRSIMIYPIPAEFNDEGIDIPLNYELSETDKAFVKAVYGSHPSQTLEPRASSQLLNSTNSGRRFRHSLHILTHAPM
ncbi:metalloprotease [Drechslerella dactyloides]|uniref:Metalloprotease n=1 Tax=Drechslerella dactyloides TaxID=74499 RepID=A0AAD6IQA2_DREDA|nr:metalloprotease [Drechslerella dactyloides]